VNDERLKDLLLSPRARQRVIDGSFMSCNTCFQSLAELKSKKYPPKFAISNGFAIGHMPINIMKEVTPLVNNLLAPVRAFNYFLCFTGGRGKKITENFTFFAQDIPQNLGALHHCQMMNNNNPSVFIILSGSFTSGQITKIRKQGSYNVETFKTLYGFLCEHNPHYENFPPVERFPIPMVEHIQLNDEEITATTDSNSAGREEQICWRYWFPTNADPNCFSGMHKNQSEFAKALFVGESPTLLFHPSKVVSHAKLSELCPLALPFGTGDVDCRRKPYVSDIECLQHYTKISLPQFQDGQTILIIHHIYQRRKSFFDWHCKM
jgi:hypothetical protein